MDSNSRRDTQSQSSTPSRSSSDFSEYLRKPNTFFDHSMTELPRFSVPAGLSGLTSLNWWNNSKRNRKNQLFVAVAVLIVICWSYVFLLPDFEETHELPSLPPIPPHENEEVNGDTGYCTTWPVDKNVNYTSERKHTDAKIELQSFAPKGGWTKPAGIKIIAVIFAGRRRTMDILDCYLQQNLVSNGGYLDEVYFMINTEDQEDVTWLRKLTAQTEEYTFYTMEKCGQWGCIWNYLTADDTIYIKMDDDMVYLHPDAIPRVVQTRIEHPNPFAISGNIVNTMLMGYMHYRTGALHAFYPEPESKPTWAAAETWKISELPRFPSSAIIPDDYDILAMEPAFSGQRWLPVGKDTTFDMLKTPIGRFDAKEQVTPWGSALRSWAQGVQQEYSLLQNLEQNTLGNYVFGSNLNNDAPGVSDTLWDTKFLRYNLNFCAIWGKDVQENLPIGDDEQDITERLPKKTGRPYVIETRALVTHFHFGPQKDAIIKTDLMDRWRAYANDQVCSVDNLKRPFDVKCEGY